jgi:hypothetical protein
MQQVYPSAFCHCKLYLSIQNGIKQNVLYFPKTQDIQYIQVEFSSELYESPGTVFYCDRQEAKDGGFPYLVLLDIIKQSTDTNDILELSNRFVRIELIKLYLQDATYLLSNGDPMYNEYRVVSPMLFHVTLLDDVMTNIFPNYYGIVYGVEFANDAIDLSLEEKERDDMSFVMRRTSYSDVYELYQLDGITRISENYITYIPTLELSNKVTRKMQGLNSMRVKCEWNRDRQKYVPIV